MNDNNSSLHIILTTKIKIIDFIIVSKKYLKTLSTCIF